MACENNERDVSGLAYHIIGKRANLPEPRRRTSKELFKMLFQQIWCVFSRMLENFLSQISDFHATKGSPFET